MNKILISAALAIALAGAGILPASAQTSAALTGQVTSAEEGAMEGVLVSAKKAGSTSRSPSSATRRAATAFPPPSSSPGNIHCASGRSATTSIVPPTSAWLRNRPATARPEAAQDRRSRRPALERGMARELPRQRPAEERDARLRGLPHARARGALDPHARRFHPRHAAAHAGLREPEHPGRTRSFAAASGGWKSAATSASRSIAAWPTFSAASI